MMVPSCNYRSGLTLLVNKDLRLDPLRSSYGNNDTSVLHLGPGYLADGNLGIDTVFPLYYLLPICPIDLPIPILVCLLDELLDAILTTINPCLEHSSPQISLIDEAPPRVIDCIKHIIQQHGASMHLGVPSGEDAKP